MNQNWRELNEEETRVIVNKGTERPFSGVYDNHFAKGAYICRRCSIALYRSEDKFNAGCGWPAFDDEIPGAIKRIPDSDGKRTEIICAACEGHLGHVFSGERLTPRNVRHCVNSISMQFVPQDKLNEYFKTAIFAGGCFWGVEYYMQQSDGVISVTSGYIGGHLENPTYAQVCRGDTGHAEAVEVLYDPLRTNYETLTRLFFEIHDPEDVNRQGPDIGEQYRSAIFVANDEQKVTATKLIDLLKAKGLKVATSIEPATKFWPAEEYHQDYYFRNRKLPYCHRRVKRF